MLIDVHAHVCALAGGGFLSEKRISSIAFRFMRWRLGIRGPRATWQDQLERILAQTIAAPLDAAVVLAFDAVYDREGNRRDDLTDMYVDNDYVAGLSRRFPQMLFGASVHPYRQDAVAELERCIHAGAVLVKWLPLTQQMDPSDARCIPFYEAMAHHGIPLLCHTGGEKTLRVLDKSVRDPRKLALPLQRGVKVIAAHCATRSIWGEPCYLDEFCAMAKEHEHFYGDTAAITLPNRSYCIKRILGDDAVRRKLVHGSDWPVISAPLPRIGWSQYWSSWREPNWMKRDVIVKRAIGFDDDYFARAATILRMPPAARSSVPR